MNAESHQDVEDLESELEIAEAVIEAFESLEEAFFYGGLMCPHVGELFNMIEKIGGLHVNEDGGEVALVCDKCQGPVQ